MATIVEAFTQQFTIDTTNFASGSKQAEQMLNYLQGLMSKQNTEMERVAKGVGYAMERVQHGLESFLGLTLSFAGFKNLIFNAADSASALGHLSDALGMSTKVMDTWQRTVKAVGGHASSVSELFTKMKFDVVKYQMDYLHRPERWMVMLNNAGVPWDVILDPDPSKPIMYLSRMLEQKRQRSEWSQAKVRTYVEELTSDIAFQDLILSGPAKMQEALTRMEKAGGGGLTKDQDKAGRNVLLQLAKIRFSLISFRNALFAAVEKGISKAVEMYQWLIPEATSLEARFDSFDSSLTRWLRDLSKKWLVKLWIWLHCGAQPREMEDEARKFYERQHQQERIDHPYHLRDVPRTLGTPPQSNATSNKSKVSSLDDLAGYQVLAASLHTTHQRHRRQHRKRHHSQQLPHTSIVTTNKISSDIGKFMTESLQGSMQRTKFAEELKRNPALKQRLFDLIAAEVGTQGPLAKQAFIESVMNRASARGTSLEQEVNSHKYFSRSTTRHVGAGEGLPVDNILEKVLSGSDVSGLATGNASGKVWFGGGPTTLQTGGERFGIEKQDLFWAQQVRKALAFRGSMQALPSVPAFQGLNDYLYGKSIFGLPPHHSAASAAVADAPNKHVTLTDNTVTNFDTVVVHTSTDTTHMAKDIHKELGKKLGSPDFRGGGFGGGSPTQTNSSDPGTSNRLKMLRGEKKC